jgi:hypothetical protein
MALAITHLFNSTIADDPALTTYVRPSNWNANHSIAGTLDVSQLPSQAARLDIPDQNITGGANVTSVSLAAGNVTIDCGKCPLQFITNSAAFTITAPVADGSCMLLITNAAGAGAITFSGFSSEVNHGDSINATVPNKFTLSIWRINGTASYRVAAHQ